MSMEHTQPTSISKGVDPGIFFRGGLRGYLSIKMNTVRSLRSYLVISRYIHLNPVRAGMVKAPLEYPWSSYRYFVGRDKKPEWLTTEFILEDFGGEGRRGFKKYREYVERGENKEIENPLKKVIASTFLGGKDFIDRIKVEYLGGKEIDKRDLPALKKILMGPSLESIERAVIKIVGGGYPLFKKICIYLSYQYSGLSLREMGEYFGMQRSAISQMSRRFTETIKGDQELREVLGKIEKEGLLNVAA
jgi:putative transposase